MVFDNVKSVGFNKLESKAIASYGIISRETDSSLTSLDENVLESIFTPVWLVGTTHLSVFFVFLVRFSSPSTKVVAAKVFLLAVRKDLDIIVSAPIGSFDTETGGSDEEARNPSDVDGPGALSIVGVSVGSDGRRKCCEFSDVSAAIRERRFSCWYETVVLGGGIGC